MCLHGCTHEAYLILLFQILGKFSNTTGSESCEECEEGMLSNLSMICSHLSLPTVGYYSKDMGQTSCDECEKGDNLNQACICTHHVQLDILGHYSDTRGQSICQPCPKGLLHVYIAYSIV